MTTRPQYRTLFLSDVHLGTPDCQAGMLLDFLREHDAETVYLIGDIIDCWRMKRKGFYWPQPHNDVVQKLLRKARHGARMVYVPGNHDEVLRGYLGVHFGGIEVTDRHIHKTADDRKLLVIHGDQFDMVVMNAKWLAHFGDWAYGMAMFFNKWVNRVRRLMGFEYWSISRWAKLKVKQAVNFIGDFEAVLADEARKNQLDGIVCGHIHHAADHMIEDVHYYNTGDWVESCTAIVEHHDGRMEIIDWSEIVATRQRNAKLKSVGGTKQRAPEAA